MKKNNVEKDYLKTLERIKRQYQEYIEVSGLYNLPTANKKEKSADFYGYSTTTNTLDFKKGSIAVTIF